MDALLAGWSLEAASLAHSSSSGGSLAVGLRGLALRRGRLVLRPAAGLLQALFCCAQPCLESFELGILGGKSLLP